MNHFSLAVDGDYFALEFGKEILNDTYLLTGLGAGGVERYGIVGEIKYKPETAHLHFGDLSGDMLTSQHR